MLAQIAEEIHAPYRAAQDTGEGGNSEYQDLGLEVDEEDPTDTLYIVAKVPFPARAQVCVFLRCMR